MKKVLIALDYNPGAENIAATGYALAKAMQASVVLLHVMEETGYYSAYEYSPITGFNNFSTADVLMPDTIEELRKGVAVFLDASKQRLGDEAIETLVEDGEAATTIVDTAVKLQADIIVMGSHSRRGLDKILMGSVAEKVLRHSKIPLFIIPAK